MLEKPILSAEQAAPQKVRGLIAADLDRGSISWLPAAFRTVDICQCRPRKCQFVDDKTWHATVRCRTVSYYVMRSFDIVVFLFLILYIVYIPKSKLFLETMSDAISVENRVADCCNRKPLTNCPFSSKESQQPT